MDYKFELLSTGSLVIRLQKEFDTLEAFLNVEVSTFGDWITETVDKILNKKKSSRKNKCKYFWGRCSKRYNSYI
ncbi:antitoxin [Bacillus anthracis]|nr:antitoxin [Bacillus anthracis]